ncbi:hypothetical protein VCRA2114E365_260021 [Vibrio crassostreae]|nr:hypothetical protein VCRA2114O369_250061 [Vibrio crassostreae]CAK1949350.1 hypothetical protein VCRA2113O362_250061 [Vibrio crassostreae]CAK1950162.1 hypothetical protein VCRA2114O367_260021 [Vibrio crassostreae]CAK2316365.1 hypothetical protein VCRA2113O361_250021 [Vibrio crassostreae]CAK2328475.1 hypothetical protein VCRA2113O355_250061 [Vibrio crassostreae]
MAYGGLRLTFVKAFRVFRLWISVKTELMVDVYSAGKLLVNQLSAR